MMEMEPFPFFLEDPTGMAAAAATAGMEDFLTWDLKGLSDPVSPVFDPSPLPSEEDMLLWGIPPPEECATPLGALPPPPPEEQLSHWDLTPMVQSAAPAAPLLDQPLPAPAVRQSAFVGYERGSYYGECPKLGAGGGKGENIHKRMMEYLMKMPTENAMKKAAESSRCFRHMMRERQRREKLSQSYADLHSMIVPRPKANKNSIVLSAAAYVRELKGTREALQRRHQELKASLGEAGGRPEAATIKLRVGNPSSPIDSMISALQQLKSMDVRARSIRSCAGDRELSAVIDVETKMAGKEVEKAVQGTLVETERKLRRAGGATNVTPEAPGPQAGGPQQATWHSRIGSL